MIKVVGTRQSEGGPPHVEVSLRERNIKSLAQRYRSHARFEAA